MSAVDLVIFDCDGVLVDSEVGGEQLGASARVDAEEARRAEAKQLADQEENQQAQKELQAEADRRAQAEADQQAAGGAEEHSADRGPVYYKNCSAVRAAGAAPIYIGEPGYSRKLDRDGDGIGCE